MNTEKTKFPASFWPGFLLGVGLGTLAGASLTVITAAIWFKECLMTWASH